jgi:hypothetical protein
MISYILFLIDISTGQRSQTFEIYNVYHFGLQNKEKDSLRYVVPPKDSLRYVVPPKDSLRYVVPPKHKDLLGQ